MIEEFFKITTNLKKIPRKGWTTKLGISSPESVADHTFSMSTIAMVLADLQKLNTEKVLKMSLLHDIAESITGDLTPDDISKDEKLEFLRKSVTWIEGRDIMDSCFVLNFGYEAPLPWPQVLSVFESKFFK